MAATDHIQRIKEAMHHSRSSSTCKVATLAAGNLPHQTRTPSGWHRTRQSSTTPHLRGMAQALGDGGWWERKRHLSRMYTQRFDRWIYLVRGPSAGLCRLSGFRSLSRPYKHALGKGLQEYAYVGLIRRICHCMFPSSMCNTGFWNIRIHMCAKIQYMW
jgi:hypothetical protein